MIKKVGKFCTGGGCMAKIGSGTLSEILEMLPQGPRDEKLLIGYESSDDAAVYKLTDEIAIVQTLDFFPSMVDEPYIFGQIAAANALSDIYAMGGEVKTALNILCFPEEGDLKVLAEILRGGAEKVMEAGGILSGGHSIHDERVKYGLSVTGIVHPDKIYPNNGGRCGDKLILTKKLGVGILCTAARIGEGGKGGMVQAVKYMTELNRRSAQIGKRYEVHGCTDVTGFGFLGHLHEMLGKKYSCRINCDKVPYITEAWDLANEFLVTAGGQKNRNHLEGYVDYGRTPFAMQEILLDPQTSGGLLFAVKAEEAEKMLEALQAADITGAIVGEIIKQEEKEIYLV